MPETETTAAPSFEERLLASVDAIASSATATPATKSEDDSGDDDTTDDTSATLSDDDSGDETDSEKSNADINADDDDDSDNTDDEGPSDGNEDEEDPEFSAAAAKHNIAQSLDDLPEEARPIVQKKLKAMEAGFTRAMQEARAYRAEKATFDAERAYERDHPDHAIADALTANPALLEKVNAELERRQNPTYAATVAKERDVAKREATLAAQQDSDATAARMARAAVIEDYTEQAAAKAGIPLAFVEDAVAAAILTGGKGDISEADVDAIVTAKAKTYNKHASAIKGAQTRQYAKDKANDAKTAGTVRTSSAGGAPQRTRQNDAPKPKDLREFVSQFVENNS